MIVTRQQLMAIAPHITADDATALFEPNSDKIPQIQGILANFGITEPSVVAQFLTCCSLASERFTKFYNGFLGQDVITWLNRVAKEFYDYKLGPDAKEWDWRTVADNCAVTFPIGDCAWLEVNNRLGEVCAALGVEDLSEKFAIEE